MHLLAFIKMYQPGTMFRLAVIGGQCVFATFFGTMYVINPTYCHRLVGYVEEEACSTYTKIIGGIEAAPEGSELAAWRTQIAPAIGHGLCGKQPNNHHHAIEQASRRWRGEARTPRRKILISTQAGLLAPRRGGHRLRFDARHPRRRGESPRRQPFSCWYETGADQPVLRPGGSASASSRGLQPASRVAATESMGVL